MEYLKLENVSKYYGESKIFDSLNFSIERNKIVSILGPSGCGKSTLLKLISGLETPSSGSILLEGTSIINNTNVCSFMSQEGDLLAWRTLFQNLILPLEIKGIERKQARQIGEERLRSFNLFEAKDLYPIESSGGMNQRINLLRTFLLERDIVLLDEPFSKIDQITKIDLMNYLISIWQERKATVIIVTHDLDEALYLSDAIIVLSKNPTKITHKIYMDNENKKELYLTSSDYINKRSNLINILRKASI
ncbi:MAG: transporter ATP-binding protein [Bacillales bacterium]|jgi:ABC-type nitrate/sulfonate/bicarbonate transport system ATPase subunit|nr:transporter ATP-binding protein [Bacillales bacterium]